MEDKDKTNVANGHVDPETIESRDILPSRNAASNAVRLNRGGRAGERRVSGSGTRSREAGSELLAKIRTMNTTRAEEITEAFLGEGSAYVDTLLQSSVALRKAVETAEAFFGPNPGGDYTEVTYMYKQRKSKNKRAGAKGGRGSLGRGRGRGSRGGSRGGSSAQHRKRPTRGPNLPRTIKHLAHSQPRHQPGTQRHDSRSLVCPVKTLGTRSCK